MDKLSPDSYPKPHLPKEDTAIKLGGQVAIVTGSSSGIGQECAIALGQAGARVTVNYRSSEDGAKETVAEIEKAGGEAIIVQADVSKEEDVQRLFRETVDKWGAVDILVANAGLQQDAAFEDLTLKQWNTVIGVNLTGQFLCCREAVRLFKKQGVRPEVSCAAGKIICMSSVHERIPWAGHVNYAASKGGILMMMKSIAQEVAPHRIRVNSICPGAIRTPINEEAWKTEEAYNALMALVPYNRIGEPPDIGRAVVWMASDESDYMVGHSLFIDGGMNLYPSFEHGG